MVKFISFLMAVIALGASPTMTLDEKYENTSVDSGVLTEVKPLKKPPFVDGGYDVYDETDGYVQPRFIENTDGTIGGAGQNTDGTVGGAGQNTDGTMGGAGQNTDGTMGGAGQNIQVKKEDVNAFFEAKSRELDIKYSKMFELRQREDELSDELRQVSEDYWKLKEQYDREYKKLLREWSKSYDLLNRA